MGPNRPNRPTFEQSLIRVWKNSQKDEKGQECRNLATHGCCTLRSPTSALTALTRTCPLSRSDRQEGGGLTCPPGPAPPLEQVPQTANKRRGLLRGLAV